MTSLGTKPTRSTAPLPKHSLTERDLRLLQAVGEYRLLTAPRISKLLFLKALVNGTPVTHSNCQYRLKLLTAQGFLLRFEQPHLLHEGRKPYVYVLSRRGAQLVADWRDIPNARLPYHKEGKGKLSGTFLAHVLLCNDVRVAVSTAVASTTNTVQLVTWHDEQTLRHTHSKDKVPVKQADGRLQQRLLVPDGYMQLRTTHPEAHTYHHFLEIDRGTETGLSTTGSRRDWASKVTLHCAYYDSGTFQTRYGGKGLRVLTVTTSESRLQFLKQVTETVSPSRRFYFTTIDCIMAASNVLSTPLWHVASDETLHPLLW